MSHGIITTDARAFTTYVLRSLSSGSLYIGSTGDFSRRLNEHQSGLSRYTRNRGPWEVVLAEHFSTRAEAMKREKLLKTGVGRDWLAAAQR